MEEAPETHHDREGGAGEDGGGKNESLSETTVQPAPHSAEGAGSAGTALERLPGTHA